MFPVTLVQLRKGYFYFQLPTEPCCVNKNDTTPEQVCSPKQKRCVVLRVNVSFLCNRELSCSAVCSVFLLHLCFSPLEKPDALCPSGITEGPRCYPVLRVCSQGSSSLLKRHIGDVRIPNNVSADFMLFC